MQNQDQNISEEELSSVFEAYVIDEAGNKIPLEVETKIQQIGFRAINGANIYAITGVARSDKSKSGTANPSDSSIKVTASGTVYWTDNLGIHNVLTAVSGNWKCIDGSTVSNTKIEYGTKGPGSGISNIKTENVGTTFSKSNLDMEGETVLLTTYAIAKSSGGKSSELWLRIKPGILD